MEVKNNIKKEYNFLCDSYVCWYIDDYTFDGTSGIWKRYKYVLKVLKHFDGVITPDFSTYQDFPDPLKRYNTYRMRAYGYWLCKNDLCVINNVRWGTNESFSYCFDGLPQNSILAIGTVGGSPRKLLDRNRFEEGLHELVNRLHPHTLIVYGSANYPCFKELTKQGIKVISYPSHTAKAFTKRGKSHE